MPPNRSITFQQNHRFTSPRYPGYLFRSQELAEYITAMEDDTWNEIMVLYREITKGRLTHAEFLEGADCELAARKEGARSVVDDDDVVRALRAALMAHAHVKGWEGVVPMVLSARFEFGDGDYGIEGSGARRAYTM